MFFLMSLHLYTCKHLSRGSDRFLALHVLSLPMANASEFTELTDSIIFSRTRQSRGIDFDTP
ncbi:hypothetical protein BDZ94DRAFT_1254111 [Collybia nuda]|uniref:Uncharacterized protein n=1 Tax=Collybia nuda TaxID=64659 RepID=A0A9P6CGH4_9AGAR|nr:hypothetical protein BDZ94DRAFT_1254111 [Collybia nuda]